MSSQQSTLESVRDTASSTIETVANAVSTTPAGDGAPKEEDKVGKDSHGNKFKKGDFKDKLNEAAHGGPPQKEPSFTEKGISALQQHAYDQGPEENQAKDDKAPPTRPDHDVPIEQFLRHQYKSTSGEGLPDPSSSK
ncbi:hypothetical protein CJF32_00002831 [Rutstroemia sp. NJR-2017a WRK4]|nr:hypothetical protein CJF32_00002831 [Rutstroemia sp. NJR-2017a WRK4]